MPQSAERDARQSSLSLSDRVRPEWRGIKAYFSSDTSSYCKARGRIQLSFLQQIHRRVATRLGSRVSERDQWHGFTLKAMDGSSVHLMDTVVRVGR